MPRPRWLHALIVCLFIFISTFGAASADDPQPKIQPLLPIPPEAAAFFEDSLPATSAALLLPPLKAVLIVGNIDGDYGAWTLNEVNNMKLAEAVLRQNGVTVYAFYPPYNDYNAIKSASQGAHFFYYRGHGVEWSADPLIVGGMALSDGKNGYIFISNDMIRADLHLAKNAIVMLYGCYTAGSYGGEVNLTSPAAQDRVHQYAGPFVDVGAAGYYANWFGDAFEEFTKNLFAGMTLGQSYQSFPDFNATTVERLTFPYRADLAMWLDKDYYSGGWKYNNAFVGKSADTLQTLFTTLVVLNADEVAYLATEDSKPRSRTVTISALGELAFSWQANLSSPVQWASLSTTSGVSGTGTTVTLNPDNLKPGLYETSLVITTSTTGVLPAVQTIPVHLVVVETVYRTNLPIISRLN